MENIKNFLEVPYDELEKLNLEAASKGEKSSSTSLQTEYTAYLKKEKRIKAVTICFTDIEGRFHMLDYDKSFFLESISNLTFDGSSVRGFTLQHESDLRLQIDWASIRHLPSDVFGPGKIVFFASVLNPDRTPHYADFRARLGAYTDEMLSKRALSAFAATEIEGFLVDGVGSEQEYDTKTGFKLISSSGYYHSLPMDKLRYFIDRSAEAQRAMGFKNEKDHPEVAPSQFEMNFSYTEAIRAADNVQLYKLVCRQVARTLGMTATFLPKPFMGINGSGMHTNLSLSKNGKNVFYDTKGQDGLSKMAWDFILKILNHAPEICLILNSSVNSYRRLDPHFEAPNQIKVSSVDRGSMIRIPLANERSARIELRSVAPDANPYLLLYTMLRTGFEGEPLQKDETKRDRLRFLPDNLNDAITLFKSGKFVAEILGEEAKEKFVHYKQAVADRSPKELGTRIKLSEVIYHHEITNQHLWNGF